MININVEDIDCFGNANGAISVDVIGGPRDSSGNFLTYQYLWSKEGEISFSRTTKNIEGLSFGSYSLSVVDSNLCTITFPSIDIAPIIGPLEVEVIGLENLSGFETSNGSINIEVRGGSAPYSYLWEQLEDISFIETTENLNNLSQGTYSLIVTDSRGCTTNLEASLNQPDLLEVNLLIDNNISCNGANTGAIIAEVSGGVLDYSYKWFRVNVQGELELLNTDNLLTDIGSGDYRVVVTDFNGNSESARITLTEPAAIAINNFTINNVSCNNGTNGSIRIEVVGGVGAYNFIWSTNDRTQNLENVTSGLYNVLITDENGCDFRAEFNVSEPEAIQTVGETQRVFPSSSSVNDGSISIEVRGGTRPYLFEWSTVSQGNVFTEISTSGISLIRDTSSEIYRVLITDVNSCVLEIPDVSDIEPLPLEVSVIQQSFLLCNGDATASLRANVEGGIRFSSLPNYNYEWFNIETGIVLEGNLSIISNLESGNYNVRVTDALGSVSTGDPITISEPPLLELTALNGDFINCGTGLDWLISSSVTGGVPPYNYFWNGREENGAILENVLPGFYELLVIDSNGCRAIQNGTFTPPAAIEITERIENPLCFAACTGEISLEVTGGSAPYNFNWSNGEETSTISELCSGSYEVIITDSRGCEARSVFEIINPDLFEIDLGEDITLCADQGITLDASIDRGVSYEWSLEGVLQSSSATLTISETGLYTASVTNTDGCIATDTIFVESIGASISSDFIAASQVFVGESFIVVNIADPLPDNVEWSFSPGAEVSIETSNFVELSFPEAGEYEVTFSVDLGLCMDEQTKTIVVLERGLEENLIGPEEGDSINQTFIDYTLFPNPSINGELFLTIASSTEVALNISIYNPFSNVKELERSTSLSSSHEEFFDVSNLSVGLHLVIIESSLGSQVLKLIVD